MPLNDAWNSVTLAAECSSILAAFWGPGEKDAATARARELWGNEIRGFAVNADASRVGMLVLEYPDIVVHLFAGASRREHMLGYMNGMLQAGTFIDTAWVNSYASDIAATVPSLMVGYGISQVKPQLVVGHSLGGVVALILAFAMTRQQQNWGLVRCVTFGSPKPGDRDAAAAMSRMNLVRWQTDGDPVPHIWPDARTTPVLLAITPFRILTAGEGTVQPQGGALIYPDGRVADGYLPPEVSGWFDTDLVTWWRAISGRVAHPHHALEYARRFSLARLANPPGGPALQGQNQPLPPRVEPLRRVDVQRQAAAVIAQVHDAPPGGSTHGNPPSKGVFRYQKIDELYVVFWLDVRVASFKKGRTARKMVTAGNRFVGNYLRAPFGTGDQLNEAAQAFVSMMEADALP